MGFPGDDYSGNSRAGFFIFVSFLRSWNIRVGDASFGFIFCFLKHMKGSRHVLVEGICRVINNRNRIYTYLRIGID